MGALCADEKDVRALPRPILRGASNFREVGGQPGAHGRGVKSKLLYRSNRLSALTPQDMRVLDDAGIVAVFDLRSRREREADRTAWSSDKATTYVFRSGHKRPLVDMAADYPPTLTGALDLMHELYAQMPNVMAHVFSEVITRIAGGALPCIIHCSAGKDRTGVAMAILLAALGVSRADIIDDYLRTNLAPDLKRDMVCSAMLGSDAPGGFASRYPPEALAAVLNASPTYIEAALDTISIQHGSVEAYLIHAGVPASSIQELRARLLEEPTA